MSSDPDKLRLIVCRVMAAEAKAVIDSGGFDDLELRAFSYDCGRPHPADEEPPWVTEGRRGGGDSRILLGGCGAGGRVPGAALALGCEIDQRDHCAYFLANRGLVDAEISSGAYVMTPGWLAGWKARLDRWGFDRETAAKFFGESAKRLALFDSGLDPGSAARLEEFSAYLGLPAVSLPVGLDYFRALVAGMASGWRAGRALEKARATEMRQNRRLADQAMAIDLMARLTRMTTEDEAIVQIMGLYEMLFGPERMVYAEVDEGGVSKVRASAPPVPAQGACAEWLEASDPDDGAQGTGPAFRVRFAYQGRLLGILSLENLAMPEHRREYAGLAESVAKLCGLALANARTYQETLQLAITDSLTGLATRRYFFSLGQREFARSRRYGHYGRPLAVLMMDIDFFKRVNDSYGHAAGDRVLAGVARLCSEELRSIDVGGRYGGEEFIFLMPETEKEMAFMAAERLRKRIEAWLPGDQITPVTVSIGIATTGSDCPDFETLVARSDKALYDAKGGGRNRSSSWEG
jgi:diguanylate cyclase (GGDEF)-like protein